MLYSLYEDRFHGAPETRTTSFGGLLDHAINANSGEEADAVIVRFLPRRDVVLQPSGDLPRSPPGRGPAPILGHG
jgi:hypothetical protein